MATTRVGVEQLPYVVSNSGDRVAVAQPLRTPRIPRLALIIGLLLAVPLLLTACGDDNDGADTSSDDKIQVITTLPLFADFVRNVGGDRVEVTSLLPLGADPHTFEPSPRDVEPITKADIAFANGLDLEPSLIKVLKANLPDDAELVLLGEEVQSESLATPVGHPGGFEEDPHLWMDSTVAFEYAYFILSELSLLDAENALTYKENFTHYGSQIIDLGPYFMKNVTNAVPPEKRKLVTTHEAFTRFANSIGFEAVAAVAESPGQEPSPNEIADLTEAIQDQHIPAVFSEPQISEESHILEQAAADAGVQVCTLYSDSLDDEVSTYIEMMRFNADELARCLGGDSDN